MIIIKDVDTIEVDENTLIQHLIRLSIFDVMPCKDNNGKIVGEDTHYIEEVVRGRIFRRPRDNKDIVIGMSKKAQYLIGIQYEAWENMEKRIEEKRKEIIKLETIIKKSTEASIFTRLKWLIFGFKTN